jgi:outer membrane protein OmpA-like peptidoglycan-associated protein
MGAIYPQQSVAMKIFFRTFGFSNFKAIAYFMNRIKNLLLICLLAIGSTAFAQPNCYDEYTSRFKRNGAEAVPDGLQKVVAGVKNADGHQSCAEGKILVKDGKAVPPLYLLREDGTYAVTPGKLDKNYYRQAETGLDLTVEMGMTAVLKLIYDRQARLFFIDYLKPDPGQVVEAKQEGNLYPSKKLEESVLQKINVSAKSIQFQSGKAVLTENSYAVLDVIAELMQQYPSSQWTIDGHTDNTGSTEKNLSLSEQRAQAVADYLVKKGVLAQDLFVNGYGQDKPIADNATAEGRKQNRRVEIKPIQ